MAGSGDKFVVIGEGIIDVNGISRSRLGSVSADFFA
jgi:hypothetical protein